jgi:L-lactate dehydrogenase complex protein LldF
MHWEMEHKPMAGRQQIDRQARDLDAQVRSSVYEATKSTHEKTQKRLRSDYEDPDALRRTAGRIKQHTLEHLDEYLEKATDQLRQRGANVHFATDALSANQQVHQILIQAGARSLIKSKSMLTEEIELVPFLERQGIACVESDLGEFIVQIDHDRPSHIVKPVAHKNRRDIARSFEREGLGAYDDDPERITRRARRYLRRKFFESDAGVSGANFVSAESGRIVLLTNEGNGRFCISANRLHIAVVGIEKLIPSDRDLALFLNLIARSATGQQLTVYTQLINGPKAAGQPDGPEELHVVFVDNGRTRILADACRDILRCIRCGACLNVCPVYRQAGGHAYRAVYPGPVGAVVSPLLDPGGLAELADLPKACSLCGACNEVCPVDIPLPDLLVRLRDRGRQLGAAKARIGTPNMGLWAMLVSRPWLWRQSLQLARGMNALQKGWLPKGWLPVAALRAWQSSRRLPSFRGGSFRSWFKHRKKRGDR